jgi:hypothetical protein
MTLPSTAPNRATDFLVRKIDLNECRFVAQPTNDDVELASGQVLLKVDKFGLTANNITYALLGTSMAYWQFFPTEEGWGRIPVWGFADVVRSSNSEVAEGERFYGYYPMSTHIIAEFTPASGKYFLDTSVHRRTLPAGYNRYLRSRSGSDIDQHRESVEVLLRPLLTSAYLIDDFLAVNGFFAAQAVILSSASSKTALGLAFLLSLRKDRPFQIIGLTSVTNRAFVANCGFVDHLVSYDMIGSLPNNQDVVFVDMAGNGAVLRAIYQHFGDHVKYCCRVGLTHNEHFSGEEEDFPGSKPVLFFAPAQIEKRTREWGTDGFEKRLEEALGVLSEMATRYVTIIHHSGKESVRSVYLEILSGRCKPEEGHVLTW